jgi:hypothetical protein
VARRWRTAGWAVIGAFIGAGLAVALLGMATVPFHGTHRLADGSTIGWTFDPRDRKSQSLLTFDIGDRPIRSISDLDSHSCLAAGGRCVILGADRFATVTVTRADGSTENGVRQWRRSGVREGFAAGLAIGASAFAGGLIAFLVFRWRDNRRGQSGRPEPLPPAAIAVIGNRQATRMALSSRNTLVIHGASFSWARLGLDSSVLVISAVLLNNGYRDHGDLPVLPPWFVVFTMPGSVALVWLTARRHVRWVFGRVEVGSDGIRIGRWFSDFYRWTELDTIRRNTWTIAHTKGGPVVVEGVVALGRGPAISLEPLSVRKNSWSHSSRRQHEDRLRLFAEAIRLTTPTPSLALEGTAPQR